MPSAMVLRTHPSPLPRPAAQVLSSLLDRASGLTDIERQQLELQLSLLDKVVGGCERILRQPMPRAYNRWVRWCRTRAGELRGSRFCCCCCCCRRPTRTPALPPVALRRSPPPLQAFAALPASVLHLPARRPV